MWGPARRREAPEGLLLNRLSRSSQVGSVLNEPLQPPQPGLEVGVFGL